MVSQVALNQELAENSYLNGSSCATKADYRVCKEVGSVDASKFPHLARWQTHISYLVKNFPDFDYRDQPVPEGVGGSSKSSPEPFPLKESKTEEANGGSDVEFEPLLPVSLGDLRASLAPAMKGKSALSRRAKISKSMSQLLRHTAQEQGLAIRADGYVLIKEMLQFSEFEKLEATVDDVKEVAAESDKQRFQIAKHHGVYYVRAVQGHSMDIVKDEYLLTRLEANMDDLPDEIVHGTYMKHWKPIREEGLLAGGKAGQKHRKHVHFAIGLPSDRGVISGMRTTCEVAIYFDLRAAVQAGLPLFRSNNNVFLSPGMGDTGAVPSRFFKRAIRIKDEVQIWPEGA